MDLVEAALTAARERGQPVADVPVAAIAAAAGISRSTLLRRLGGSRAALDEAVRQAGVDPGGRPPVRERAITAAAELISAHGLGGVTLDAVAESAECSLPSLHAVFEGRDGLLTAVFERYGPVLDLQAIAADPPERVEDIVRELHRALVTAFTREPRVVPALFADLLGRPDGPASRLVRTNVPRLLASLETILAPHASRLRPIPLPLLLQQLAGPLAFHLLLRPALDVPSLEDSRQAFAEAFLRAVVIPEP